MSMMDKLKNMLKGHEDQTSKGIDKAGDFADSKTDDKYKGQVDSTQEKLRKQYGTPGDQDQPPPS
ncbi:antitoxin [Streptomyces sp. NPDC048248]|uniref:antitoxin n=1 Tax=Streptomyces sp. NPDC048248 TaxID=3365523 RepID=UPI00371F287D